MKLHDCQMAPNPRRVRIFLAEKGVDIEKVEHSILEGETCGDEYLKINQRLNKIHANIVASIVDGVEKIGASISPIDAPIA